jgi:dynein light chain LC8-type
MADEEEEKVVAEAVVITSDMPDAMKEVAIATTRDAMNEYSIDKDIATAIKKKFDEHAEYMGTWHCIVGKNFGCSITHETEYSMFFKVGESSILLFKSME